MSESQPVPVYEMRVECMNYCYGGSPVLDLDEYPDPADPRAIVKYADHLAALAERDRQHVAALAEAEQRGREEAYNEIPAIAVYGERLRSEGYDVGYTDALAAAREAVAGLMPGHYSFFEPSTGYNVSIVTDAVRKDVALAAIDALAAGQAPAKCTCERVRISKEGEWCDICGLALVAEQEQ